MEGVTDLEPAGMKGAAVMLAHVTAGVLLAETLVLLEETLDSAGKVAWIVCKGLRIGATVEHASFVVRNRFSNLVDRNFDFRDASSPSNGMLSSKVTLS